MHIVIIVVQTITLPEVIYIFSESVSTRANVKSWEVCADLLTSINVPCTFINI